MKTTIELEPDEVQAVTLAIWKLRLERPGWENYLRGISHKITPGQFEAYELMHKDAVMRAITGEEPNFAERDQG